MATQVSQDNIDKRKEGGDNFIVISSSGHKRPDKLSYEDLMDAEDDKNDNSQARSCPMLDAGLTTPLLQAQDDPRQFNIMQSMVIG